MTAAEIKMSTGNWRKYSLFNLRIQVVWDMKPCRWVLTVVSKEPDSLAFKDHEAPEKFSFYLCFKGYCAFRLICCTDQILASNIVVTVFTIFEFFPETVGVFMYFV